MAGYLGPVVVIGGFRVGKFAHMHNKGMLREGHVNNDNDIHSSDNVCSSAHICGCVIDGIVARTAH